jgi:hypothetical protein
MMAHELEAELFKARKRIKFLEESVIGLGEKATKAEGYKSMFLSMKEAWIALKAKYSALQSENPRIPTWDDLMRQMGRANDMLRNSKGGGPQGLIL